MKISIALCTFNGEKYLRDQLDSLFNQTLKPFEIVISDDLSTDDTLNILNEYKDKDSSIRVRILDNQFKRGVFSNFPYVISKCEGDIIFTCDQDDYWLPTKLEKHMKLHDSNLNTVLVYSNADVVLNTIDHFLYPLWDRSVIEDNENGQASFKSLVIKGRSIAGCCMSFKKTFVSKLYPFPSNIYHDDWIATNACLIGKIQGINESLIKYRQHGNNAVGIIRGSKISFYKSLITNVPFYVRSDKYIYNRHINIYNAMCNSTLTYDLVYKYNLHSNLEFYKVRSQYSEVSIIESIKCLTQCLLKNQYKYHNGIFTYFKDIYNLVYIKILRVKI